MTTEGSLEEESPWLESQWYPPLDKIKRFWYDCFKLNGAYTPEENEYKWRLQNGTWSMRESIKEIDDDPDAWLVCNLILRRSEGPSADADWYDEKDNSSYHITDAPMPPPKATYHLPSTRRFRAGGDTPLVSLLDARTWMTDSAVFSIGYSGVLKMSLFRLGYDFTHAHKTLNWLQGKFPTSTKFQIPKVIRYEVQMKRHITFESQLYGLNFEQAWPILSPQQRENVITAIKDFCFELSKIKGERIGSIEGKGFFDRNLTLWVEPGEKRYDPAVMQAGWARFLAPGLSEFCFAHNFLGAHHIILIDYPNAGYSDLRVPTIGVTSWSAAGFVPKVWVRTKFVVDMEYDMSTVQRLDVKLNTGIRYDEVHKWRWSVFRGLGREPYNLPEMREEYWKAMPLQADYVGRDFIEGRGTLISIAAEDEEDFLAQQAAEREEYERNRRR
ncbi:uncharacterized protein EAE98_001775 [Botrytis deweyae]|uniref:Aminoglycoside phosphotransferase domain-containing protein n=1 Tax=Botrytis deweyae TaxID=2478750 RepID=A0ABQ7IYU5_9HELO|nr:uncharacterized protein EAE98_001775 [Botrytis deweyae]KAF7937461.1 hypothetical protein EAE98_001775 [Botrytis deweyae]